MKSRQSKSLPSMREAFDAFCMECAPEGDDYDKAMRAVYKAIYEHEQASLSENAPASEAARWDLVRRWLTHQEELYIPGIHQARTVDAVNEAVDLALTKLRVERGGQPDSRDEGNSHEP